MDEALINRVRRALSGGADRDSVHHVLVETGSVSEDDFFLAFTAANLLLGDMCNGERN